jgi:hypothetical protein
VLDINTMQENDDMALIGFKGLTMPDACYECDLLASAWRAGRNQAIDKGLIQVTPSNTKSIKIKQDNRVRVNYNRIEECY